MLENMKLALIQEGRIRDAQVMHVAPPDDDSPEAEDFDWAADEYWNHHSGRFFVGVFGGTDEEVAADAAKEAGVSPCAIEVIPFTDFLKNKT
jgi:hypothetical protein